MKIKDLIEELKKYDPKAEVVIGNSVVHGVTNLCGRIRDGHFTPMPPEKARDFPVTLAVWEERSDGQQYLVPVVHSTK